MTSPETTSIERARRLLGRAGFLVALASLVSGAVLFFAGSAEPATYFFRTAFVVLIVLPIRNIVALLIEEVRGRDWLFVGLAMAALAVLAYAVLDGLV